MYGSQAEHYGSQAVSISGASNIYGMTWQFQTSPNYVSIRNSKNIILDGVFAGKWRNDVCASIARRTVVLRAARHDSSRIVINRGGPDRNIGGVRVDQLLGLSSQHYCWK